MDIIRAQLKNPTVVGIAAFGLGLFLGLVLLGWWLFPVQWTDGTPADLRADLRVEYLRMAIETMNTDPQLAQKAWKELGAEAEATLADLEESPGTLAPEKIAAFKASMQIGAPATTTPGTTETAKGGGSSLITVLVIMCVVTLLLGAGLAAFFLLRGGRGPRAISPAMQAQEAARQAPMTDYASVGEPPMAQFMASYKIGDDLFDDSFSIDSASGEFLGECGVGISETIGVGDPKKVTAFEVWLFDKNDIQTITKVLMSAHSFRDENTKQKLAAKGEPVLAKLGDQMVLETQTLQLVARVVDMTYGEGALPAESFFDQLILELAVWQK